MEYQQFIESSGKITLVFWNEVLVLKKKPSRDY